MVFVQERTTAPDPAWAQEAMRENGLFCADLRSVSDSTNHNLVIVKKKKQGLRTECRLWWRNDLRKKSHGKCLVWASWISARQERQPYDIYFCLHVSVWSTSCQLWWVYCKREKVISRTVPPYYALCLTDSIHPIKASCILPDSRKLDLFSVWL